MPAMLDDPDSPPIYRTSGAEPYPNPKDPNPPLPPDIVARQVTLRDRITIATLIPFSSASQVPASLLAYLCDQLNREIEKGDTYPFVNPMALEDFGLYWFANFGAVMLLGEIGGAEEVTEGKDWSRECLGSFYIKPNYPGRSSHVCNGGFLVTDASRNKGVGRLMGEGYLEWAPKLGYTYSVFNLVYETNVASCRIWDALGFKRIGKVKGCGNLKSYPGQLIDAHIYGRDLGPEGEDFVSEERFDKIRFYLKHGKYPNGADRAEKSRLRSAATHYKLDGERLMLKDKEVIGDRQQQYEIARRIHVLQHGGINKTTATIAEKYHWVRIKETVSQVIRNCAECKEMAKPPVVKPEGTVPGPYAAGTPKRLNGSGVDSKPTGGISAAGRIVTLANTSGVLDEHILGQPTLQSHTPHVGGDDNGMDADDVNVLMQQQDSRHQNPRGHHPHHHQPSHAPVAVMQGYRDDIPPIDPQIIEDVTHHLTQFNNSNPSGAGVDGSGDSAGDHYSGGDSTIVVQHPHHHHHHHTDYQALLAGTDPHGHHGLMSVVDEDVDMDAHHHHSHSHHHHQMRHMQQQHHMDDDNETMAAKATAAARAAQEVLRGGEDGEDDDEEGEGEQEREIQRRLVLAGYGGGDGGHGGFGGQ